MSVAFDYGAIEKITSLDLVERLRRDVSLFIKMDDIKNTKVKDIGNYVFVGFSTKVTYFLYSYTKDTGEFCRNVVNHAEYWLIQEMQEGKDV